MYPITCLWTFPKKKLFIGKHTRPHSYNLKWPHRRAKPVDSLASISWLKNLSACYPSQPKMPSCCSWNQTTFCLLVSIVVTMHSAHYWCGMQHFLCHEIILAIIIMVMHMAQTHYFLIMNGRAIPCHGRLHVDCITGGAAGRICGNEQSLQDSATFHREDCWWIMHYYSMGLALLIESTWWLIVSLQAIFFHFLALSLVTDCGESHYRSEHQIT